MLFDIYYRPASIKASHRLHSSIKLNATSMSRTIRIATYNIKNGHAKSSIASAIAELSRRSDVICLQEFRALQNGPTIVSSIRGLIQTTWAAVFFCGTAYRGLGQGLCTLWNTKRLRLREVTRVALPHLSRLSWLERLWTPSLISPYRGALVTRFSAGSTKLRVTNVHFDWQGRPQHRLRQLDHLINRLQSACSPDADVLCGDFNTTTVPLFANTPRDFFSHFPHDFRDALPNLLWTADALAALDEKQWF